MKLTTLLLSAVVGLANALGSTDTITWGGDNSRSGYQTNHNMDPAVVGSSQFNQIWRTTLPGNYGGDKEKAFSQPLVYTPSSGTKQYVYYSTTQNNVYKIDAKTGEIVASRNLAIPFLTADLNNCLDINPHVGIISTGVIDPDTDTLYLTVKTYADQTQINVAQGKPAGRYFIHALDVNDLKEKPNFPIGIEGIVARNSPQRVFNAGISLQRPALLHVGQYIYLGFGSHCVQYDFTGWIIGFDKATGKLVEQFATQGPDVPANKKGASIWMSGGGIASDNAGSIFFSTGNGYASQLATIPVKGFNPPTALEEAAVHMTIGEGGRLDVADFFMPYEKQELDGADKDLGTSPLEILPSEFACGKVKRMGVVTGKSGKTYWLDLDNLGGYRNGADSKSDNVLQTYQNENSVYAGAGVYPLEGGYVYINVIQFQSHVFKFSCNNGVPHFAKVADSPQKNGYVLGVSHGTVTSLNGQAGTGLVWVTDVQTVADSAPLSTIRIYDAIPKDGQMVLRKSFNVPGIMKFTRAVFGDGTLFVGTNQGYLYAFGAPTKSPLDCTTPVAFGAVNIKAKSEEKTITCKAVIGVTVAGIELDKAENYAITGTPNTPLQLTVGQQFTMKASFTPGAVGSLIDDIKVNTTNTVEGYRTTSTVRLNGTGSSADALLSISPNKVAFSTTVASPEPNDLSESVILTNEGNAQLTITSVQISTTGASGPFTPYTAAGDVKVSAFSIQGIPATVAANSNAVLTILFDTTTAGEFAGWVKIVTNGGERTFSIAGNAGPAPVALLQFQKPDGSGWVDYVDDNTPFNFGDVTENTFRSLLFRVTNNAGAGGVKLSLTVSKPPVGSNSIVRAANQVDLAEGTLLAPGESATAVMTCTVPKTQWNQDAYNGTTTWTMNTNDPVSGKHVIPFFCNAVTEQAPPLLANGQGKYRYVGCFKDNTPTRQLSNQLYGNDAGTNAMCIAACGTRGSIFCGTQYHRECWAGNLIPNTKVADANCNFDCAGDLQQICGGNGVGDGAGATYISLFADSTQWDGNLTRPDSGTTPITPPAGGPVVNPGVNGYKHIGCYTEATQGRALPTEGKVTSRTVANCVTACKTLNKKLAGVEYGGECWCGDELRGGSVAAPLKECNIACNANATELCGGGSRLNVYQLDDGTLTSTTSLTTALTTTTSISVAASTAPGTAITTTTTSTTSTATPTPTGPAIRQIVDSQWTFQGCYTETKNGRALSKKSYADDLMTLESCATFCKGVSASFFGVEYGRECYCGDTLREGSVKAENQKDCSFLCPGDKFTYCGAGDRLQLYKLGVAAASSTVVTTTSVTTTSVTTTSVASSAPAVSTVVTTTTTSVASSAPAVSTVVTTTTTSAEPISTIPAVKQVVRGKWGFQGCYTESDTGRALEKTTLADDLMTLEMCADFCTGSNYFGVEYGRECYCGDQLRDATVKKAEKADECSFLCPGDKLTFCGAGVRLQLYKFGDVPAVASTAAATTTTVTTSATTTTAAASTTSTTSAAASTTSTTSAAASTTTTTSAAATTTTTTSAAASTTSTASAVPTTTSTTSTTPTTTSTTSTTPTTTSTTSTAPATTSTTSTVPTTTSTTSTRTSTTTTAAATPTGPIIWQGNSNFTYYACVTEPSKGRLLGKQVFNDGTLMTTKACAERCWEYGYAGVEYGRECWCGNTLNLAGNTGATPGKNVTDTECKMTCPGDNKAYCGAGSKISLYINKKLLE